MFYPHTRYTNLLRKSIIFGKGYVQKHIIHCKRKSTSISRIMSGDGMNVAALSTKVSPYGSWKSPIDSSMVSQSSLGRINLQIDTCPHKNDAIYWIEMRASEGGRYVICSSATGEASVKEWTPLGHNARSRVHEYGGGAFFVYSGCVYFSNFSDQRMYVQRDCDDPPQPISPEKLWRYADGKYSHKTQKIYCIRESHEGVDNPQFAINAVVVLDPVTQEQNVLVDGADFYSHPRVSPDGTKICWVQWYHPNMPWDSTELWEARLSPTFDGLVEGSAKKLVSGVSVMMPSYDLNNELLYISDKTDWWNLYHVTSSGEHVNLLERKEEIGSPHWSFGNEVYAIDPCGGNTVLTLFNGILGELNRSSGAYRVIDTGYRSHSNLYYTAAGHAYCDAGGPNSITAIIRVAVETGKVDIIRESRTPRVDPGYLSTPEAIQWRTGSDGDAVSHGFFYPPCNKDYCAPDKSLPPLLVKVHGGPTSCASTRLSYKYQYFTSRGFALLDVNHRGSTGFGRTFRDLLLNNWGVVDIEDCSRGAQHLVDLGLVDSEKVCISGGSAGGYTTLACLTFTDTFKAGVSCYGIADLKVLTDDCHKFESRYMDMVISPATEAGLEIYKSRSPLWHTHKLNAPVAFFHGADDQVVHPNQAEMMYKVVKEKKIPTSICIFEGEQHGFRKSENIQKALDGEFYFFARVFGFEPADKDIVQLHIDNLD